MHLSRYYGVGCFVEYLREAIQQGVGGSFRHSYLLLGRKPYKGFMLYIYISHVGHIHVFLLLTLQLQEEKLYPLPRLCPPTSASPHTPLLAKEILKHVETRIKKKEASQLGIVNILGHAFVSWDCRNKRPRTGALERQRFILCSCEGQKAEIGRAGCFASEGCEVCWQALVFLAFCRVGPWVCLCPNFPF